MKSSIEVKTEGYGCPHERNDPHHFAVELPAARSGFVVISEVYGMEVNGVPDIVERCHLPRAVWSLIAEDLKRELNERLRSKKIATSRWTKGVNKVERLLGKELLVLAWAVERADPDTIPNAIRNWIGLRPEERWWLYAMTAAATGEPHQTEVGWRKAIRVALTENP